jgi:large repetitive protein
VADTNAGSNVEQLTLTDTNATLTLASTKGLTVIAGSNKSSSLTIKGTLANLNAALSGLTFTPTLGFSGSAALDFSYKDLLTGAPNGSARFTVTGTLANLNAGLNGLVYTSTSG